MTDTALRYLQDSYIKEFDAEVVRSGPRYVILDRTAFYPEGGGQPTDTGRLYYDSDEFRVIKVMQRGEQVYHYLDGDIPERSKVHGKVDWEKRFTYMRLHSGEHLLTGLFEGEKGGPKVFSSFSQLDFKPSDIDENTIRDIEERFNEIIDENIPVDTYYQNRDELDVSDDERKKEFLEKIPNAIKKIRMVKIGTYALTFCMGTHVKSTGEIGKLEELRVEPKKKRRKIVYFKLEGLEAP
jgi:Ser-tRNA(Ala) deacylase AlaX